MSTPLETPPEETITGPWGSARRLWPPQSSSCLAQWRVDLPGAHPFWSAYLLSIVHLRFTHALPPAYLSYPEAAYEVTLMALDPRPPHGYLTPANIVEQFHGLTDEQIPDLARLIAGALVHGAIIVEPQGIMGAKEMNRQSLDVLIAQMQGGAQ